MRQIANAHFFLFAVSDQTDIQFLDRKTGQTGKKRESSYADCINKRGVDGWETDGHTDKYGSKVYGQCT